MARAIAPPFPSLASWVGMGPWPGLTQFSNDYLSFPVPLHLGQLTCCPSLIIDPLPLHLGHLSDSSFPGLSGRPGIA